MQRKMLSRRELVGGMASAALLPWTIPACGPSAPAPTVAPEATKGAAASAPQPAPTKPAAAPEPTKPAAAAEPTKPAVAAAAAPVTGNRLKIRHGSWSGPVKVQPELYNRKQDKVEVVFELTPFAGYHDKLVVDMAAGTAPDTFEAVSHFWPSIMRKKIVLPLDDLIRRSGIDATGWNITPEQVAGFDGKIWGLPWLGPSLWRMTYNQRLFDEAGVKYPTKDWTWDDVTTAAKALHKPPDRYAMAAVQHTFGIIPDMIRSNGGRVLSEDETKAMVNSPEAIEAVQTAVDWLLKHKVAMAPGEEKALGQVAFQSDKLATGSIPGHDWAIYSVQTKGLSGKAWLNPSWPISPRTKKHAHVAEVHARAIAGKSKVADPTWEYLAWLQTSDEGVRSQLVEVGYMPTYQLRKQLDALEESRRNFYLEMMEYFKDIVVLNWGPKPTECTDAFTAEYQAALLGKKSVPDAMKDAAGAINQILAG